MKIQRFIKKSALGLVTLATLLSIAAPARARGTAAASDWDLPAAPVQGQGPTDPAEMEAFLDNLFARELEENHIAGAAVAVVKDGKLFLAKGYGYADLGNKITVEPEKTVFRIGSVTKLFTWTAVMQLVEQGKLDLDADINTYLDFRIPDTFSQPITLRHLMSHTAGFEDRHTELVTLTEEDLIPARDWLISHMPARVRPPGECAAYSNYGTALAGYIVARESGQSYGRYIQDHILDPLGMKSSTAEWPIPSDLSARESVGYMDADGVLQVFPNLIGQPAILPAGVMRATVTDMARFMIAHLQNGVYRDADISEARILEESTAQQMHSPLYAPAPGILGTAYGFFDFSDNGQRTIGHGGEAEPMQSLLLLLPDSKLGIFVAYNSMGAEGLTRQHFGFQRAFFDHYFTAPALEPIQPRADFNERADRFAGAYKWTWSSYTTMEKYATLSPALEIKNPGDGTLLVESPWGNWNFVEEHPLYFRQVDGPFHFSFREDEQGRITYLFTDFTPMLAFEKLKWYELPGFNLTLVLVSVLLFLSMLAAAMVRAFRNRRKTDERTPAHRGQRAAMRLITGVSLLNLLFVAGMILWGEQNIVPVFGVTLIYKIVLGLGVLSALLTVGAPVCSLLAWTEGYWGLALRVQYTLVTIAAAAFIWFLSFWNLLGWRY